jgi:alkylation response protein AidB-like acyl-CoA dehydrogenase/acyl-CoA synthetase (AMP-forming)/AMP-acid ligase II/acyl carrier protein
MSTLRALSHWGMRDPDRLALRCHDAFPGHLKSISYGELLDRVLRGAAVLRQRASQGARVALLLPNSIEYMVAFLAAQAAGMVPVPLMPASSKKSATQGQRLEAVIADCTPELCVVGNDEPLIGTGVRLLPVVDLIESDARGELALPSVDDIAFIQYTSGSTSTPRGVVVRERNVVANCMQMSAAFGMDESTVFGSWLPLFHDMGLIGHALLPIWLGACAHLMRPETFLRHPDRWLKMISDHKVEFSGAPNFAYDYCVERIKGLDGLDLSSWRLAINGSEQVLPATMDRFAAKFLPAQFRREYFQPVYGLAEATVFVSGRARHEPIRELDLDRDALTCGHAEQGSGDGATRYVSVGRSWLDGQIVVWNFDERRPSANGEVGEILVSGTNCCETYFGKEREASAVFGVELQDRKGTYLRTGDLGFDANGELFIVGRSKEMLLVRGRNISPQDIEEIAQASHDDFVSHGGAAVEMQVDGRQRIVLIQEIKRRAVEEGAKALKQAAMEAVARLGIALYDVVLLQRGTLPKTTSGKIARVKSRDLLVEGRFGVLCMEESPAASGADGDELVSWWRSYATKLDLRGMDERRCIAPQLVLDFGNRGFLGLRAPRHNGGAALSVTGMMRVLREVAHVDLTLAAFIGVHNGLALAPLMQFGSEQQKSMYLADLANGRALGAFALTEAAAGSNPRAMRASARRSGGKWVLDGRKIWIGNASWSSVCVFFAQAYDEDGTYLGITAFLLPTDTEGVRQGPEVMTLGMRGMVQNELIVARAVVDDGAILGEVGKGFDVASSTITFGRLGVATLALGCMERCMHSLVDYGWQRTISTGNLIEHPLVAHRLFTMQAAVQAVSALVGRCCTLIDRQESVPNEVLSALKAVATELCWKAVDDTLQAFGGRGYDEANNIPQMLRDCRLLRIFEGSSEALHSHVGHAFGKTESALQRFILDQFPATADVVSRLSTQVETLRQMVSEMHAGQQESADRFLHGAVGEAVSYLLLEVVLVHESATSSHVGVTRLAADYFRRKRESVLDDALSAIPAPWVRGDVQPLMEQVTTCTLGDCAWPPRAMNMKIEPDSYAGLAETRASTNSEMPLAPQVTAPSLLHSLEEQRRISSWIVNWVERRTRRSTVPLNATFVELGLDSVDAVELVSDFADEHGISVDPSALWEFPDISKLGVYLAKRLAPASAAVPPGNAPGLAHADERGELLKLLERELSH